MQQADDNQPGMRFPQCATQHQRGLFTWAAALQTSQRAVCAQVMSWVASYQDTCRELGINDGELEFPAGAGRGIAALVDCYTQRVHGLLNTWFTNILEVCGSWSLKLVTRCPRSRRNDISSG